MLIVVKLISLCCFARCQSLLFDLFNRVGPVASIRVCRDSVTRRSLGYAYVNFHNVQDAERALDTMNFTDIKDRPCRIMWSQRDPSLRRSGVGNVFVRNLAPSVDIKGLYDTFSVFGNILSCKVALDENGKSKRYGYVHFETAEAAQDAIQKFDGTLIDDVEVHVGTFVRRQDRAGQADWTNLYVKQFPASWDEAKLAQVFEEFGPAANVVLSKGEDGKSRGFGFVNYQEHESAVKALEALNGKSFTEEVDGSSATTELYVSRAQKKSDRARELKSKIDAMAQERATKYQGMNLYVKNIADSMTDEQFREIFAPFGTITSSRIMREAAAPTEAGAAAAPAAGSSKGFGFVCYSSPEEATRAVAELNGKVVAGKPLVVTLHQRKEHRRAHLAATYAPRGMNFPPGAMGQAGAGGMPLPFMGMYMPQQPGGAPGAFPGAGMGPRGMPYSYPGGPAGAGGRGSGNMNVRNMGYGAPRPGMYPNGMVSPFMAQGGVQQMGGQFKNAGRGQGGFPQQGGMGGRGGGGRGGPGGPVFPNAGRGGPVPGSGVNALGAPRGFPAGAPGQQMPGQPQNAMRNGIKFSNQVRNPSMPMQGNMAGGAQGVTPQQAQAMSLAQQQAALQQMQMQMVAPNKSDFSDAALAQADPQTQKNMIGERLYPLIYQHQPEQAGKITGMLLEMDNGELLNLIESPDALMSKIEEALNVLRNHKSDE